MVEAYGSTYGPGRVAHQEEADTAPSWNHGAVRQTSSVSTINKPLVIAGGVAGVAAGAASAAWLGAAAYLARLLLTPVHAQPDNVTVHQLDISGERIVLGITPDTVLPGRYGLWFGDRSTHLRLGDVIERDDDAGTVTRSIEAVDFGEPALGSARWDSYLWAVDPGRAFDIGCEDVLVPSEVGLLPAWYVPAAAEDTEGETRSNNRWAVLVHGRGATRHETMRSVPVLHEMGLDVLVPAYRNAPGAPASEDGLYNLGLSEWRDVEASVQYAVEHGATQVVLFGWSMGGAVVLQMLDLSPLASLVDKVVLDSPVIDWVEVIGEQARLRNIPNTLAVLAENMIGQRWARRLVGVHEPLDVARTSWQRRAGELTHPMLLMHSVDDEIVPVGASRELAAKRPDIVRYEEWQVARHVKEWNTDPDRWNTSVREFLSSSPASNPQTA